MTGLEKEKNNLSQESQDIDEQLEDLLEEMKPQEDDFIERRIKHINFAKIIFWLCVKARREEFVYASDLAKFLRYSQTWAYQNLINLCNAGVLRKVHKTAVLVEFWFKIDELTGKPKVFKYLEKAQKTLGVKFKIVYDSDDKVKGEGKV